MQGPRAESARYGLGLAAAAFLVALVLPAFGVFEKLENATFDLRLTLRGHRAVHPGIVILEIDQTTITAYKNAWPLPRDQYALMLDDLRSRGVRTVGIDLLFVGADRILPAPGEPTNDQILAAVIARDPRIINGVYFSLAEPGGSELVPEEGAPLDSTRALWQRFTIPLPEGIRLMRAVSSPFDLEPSIAESTATVGHVGLYQDIDGVSRALPLLVEYQGRAFPALSLAMAANYLGADWRQIRFAGGNAVLPYPGGEARIPVDRHGRISISFPGDISAFKSHVRFLDVLNEIAERTTKAPGKPDGPDGASDILRDKVVLVCNTATTSAISDFGPTPFGPSTPLAYAHASVLNSILRNDYIREVPKLIQYGVWIVTAIFLGLLLSVMAPIPLALTTLASIAAYFLGSLLLTSFGGYQTALVPPVVMILIISVGLQGRGYFVRDVQRRAQEQELAVARRIQQGLLPKDVLHVDGIEVAGMNLPCFAVGGDYFDYFPTSDGKIALAIADVSGKGVPAALLMSNLQAIFRAECARGASVALVPEQANRQLMDSMAGNSKFVTFFYGALDAAERRLSYSNAGHNPPLVVRTDGSIEELAIGGLLLGVFPLATYDVGEVTLSEGDVLVLFTDGVTEAESRQGLYGDERLHELVRRLRTKSAHEIGQAICDDVAVYSHGLHQSDDVTIVVVKVKQRSNGAASA